MVRRLRMSRPLCAALSWLLVAFSAWAAPSDNVPVYEVEAEFIERFTRFIDWPDAAFAAPDAPFAVCTWGGGVLSAQLERSLSRRHIKGRPVRMLRVGAVDQLASCHVLYLALGDPDLVRTVSNHTHGRPILSIGDQPGLAEAGLFINLVVGSDGLVRFEINREVASASKLKVSSKLLRLARLVEGRR